MNELVGIITNDNYLSDDLIKDVLCIVGGYNPLRLGEAGCQFSLKMPLIFLICKKLDV